jgi:hypothetical protein
MSTSDPQIRKVGPKPKKLGFDRAYELIGQGTRVVTAEELDQRPGNCCPPKGVRYHVDLTKV